MPISTINALPLWRSMLFVPANMQKFIDSAPRRGADAYILDLEDSVPLAQRPMPGVGYGRRPRPSVTAVPTFWYALIVLGGLRSRILKHQWMQM